ncbi:MULTISPECIES: DUF6286 domain-containing protein [Corynebacterium]|uniref:DUF6286 domain-containing protein n=1 Tax=Corynebacterium TaxID=1716 RepID=UPI00124D39ED|nr:MULTISPECIES: DUF6286 domain-containing protein [Corynebacterium]MBV7282107.1 hypothetical protein [Corynebacterium sp. TAE3-ERU30]MBV7302983.1 hypothetical protein [Corynebacterium sp. TAE3-ERU2]
MKAQPAARGVAIFIGLLLVAAGAIAGRELWVLLSDTNQSSWIEPVLNYLRDVDQWATWMFAVAGACAALALILLFIAFKPRSTTHLEYSYGDTTLHIRRVDFARLLTATALSIPGVRAAESTVRKKKAGVQVQTDFADEAMLDKLRAEEEKHVHALSSSMKLKITTHNDGKES